jgi:hypothetical protein
MAKISNEDRIICQEKAKKYKEAVESVISRERNILVVMQKDSVGAPFMRLNLADEMLNLASYYVVINNLYVSLLHSKNEDALNEARKALYKSIIYLEETVSGYIDAPYSDYEDKVALIADFNLQKRYLLVRKMGLAIRLVIDAYGDNTKWKWSFVELEGRFAAVAKNLFDIKNAYNNLDPRAPDYETTVYYLRTVKKLLAQSADRYREKYELSTNRIDDFKQAILFLSALKRIHLVMSERDDIEQIKKKIEIWNTKLEADQKKQEAERKKA